MNNCVKVILGLFVVLVIFFCVSASTSSDFGLWPSFRVRPPARRSSSLLTLVFGYCMEAILLETRPFHPHSTRIGHEK